MGLFGIKKYFIAVIGLCLLAGIGTQARAYDNYAGCEGCHGAFDSGNYTSQQDGTDWGTDLMSAHSNFVGGQCQACHMSLGPGDVFLNDSGDASFTKGCVGCHGRDEDVNGMCVGGGGVQVECGSGAGLRKMHENNVGAGTCSSCHANDPAPVGEDVLPFNYSLAGSLVKNSCDEDGSESRFGPTGLDNDGDGQRDAADSDCSDGFAINAGLNDAWVNADAPLQGLFITVFEDLGLVFISWFTFDSALPSLPDTAVFGAFDQRWVTGLGAYSGDTVTISVELTSGGVFNASEPMATQTPNYGTITIQFINCNEAILTYDFPSLGISGQMTITRVLTDNVALCEALSGG